MITVTPCAKINLGLNITEKRADGYHNLETVFYPVPLFDRITIKENNTPCGSCSLTTGGISIDGDPEKNLVVKAYRRLCQTKMLPGVEISLDKDIPTQAGMGGGSADCAYTLTALNEMFHIGLSDKELERTAASLGADCAFFVKSEPCFASGIGDVMEPVALCLDDYWIVVVKLPISVSTKDAFAGIKPQKPMRCCRDIIENEPVEKWRQLLQNDFESTIFTLHPTLALVKEKLYSLGAEYAAMSGSGSALFGLFNKKPQNITKQSLTVSNCRIEIKSLRGTREKFPLVDDEGNTTGWTSRSYAHGGMKPLHPVVHLHVFNKKGELYLQKRPEWKDIQPGKWDTAVGGHVDYGETIVQALHREVLEEIGISEYSPESMGRYVFESDREKELVNVFRTTYDTPLHPSTTELDGGRFFSHEEIAQRIGKGVFTPNFEKEWLRLFSHEG